MVKIHHKTNVKAVQRKMARIVRGMKDFTKPLKKAEKFQLKQIQDTFKTSGRTTTEQRWKKLQSSTLRAKLRGGFQTEILVRTGKLKRSFEKIRLTSTELQITSKDPKYKFHQKGTRRMPQRQIAGFSKKMADETTKILVRYMLNLVK